MLDHEIQHYDVDNTNITMPEAFLKSWLKNSSNGEVTDSVLEKDKNACAQRIAAKQNYCTMHNNLFSMPRKKF